MALFSTDAKVERHATKAIHPKGASALDTPQSTDRDAESGAAARRDLRPRVPNSARLIQ